MYVSIPEYRAKKYRNTEALTDGELEMAIISACRTVDEYCGTRFVPTENTEILDLMRKIHPCKLPLIDVLELTVSGQTLNPGADYYVTPRYAEIELADTVFGSLSETVENGRQAVTVAYRYGYGQAPETVKTVVCELVNLSLSTEPNAGKMYAGMQSESYEGDYSYTRGGSADFMPVNIRKQILSALDVYKRETANPKRPADKGVVRGGWI